MKKIVNKFTYCLIILLVFISFSLITILNMSDSLIYKSDNFAVTTKSTDSNSTSYTVEHFFEPIYDLSNQEPELTEYELKDTETFNGIIGESTHIVPKNCIGFTSLPFNQQTIGEETIIKIYYKRNQYQVTIQTPEYGFESITGAGRYVYGAKVNLVPDISAGFNFYTWTLDLCDDNDFAQNFANETICPSFVMPASDLTLTPYVIGQTFLVTVNIVGNGYVSPNTTSVNYGDNISFELFPCKDSELKAVYRDGVAIKFTETESHTFVVDVYTIIKNTEITVIFHQMTTQNTSNWTNIIVWVSGGLVVTIIIGSSVAMSIITFHKQNLSSIKKMSKKQSDVSSRSKDTKK